MLKPYSEMRKINVLPFCDKRKGKDENGNPIEIPYLNWLKCRELLIENGAERADYKPAKNTDGTFLFPQAETTDKNGRKTHSYFVAIELFIDDKVYFLDFPVMNGNSPVYDETLNQQRIDNSHKRAFVKCVALNTGLGIDLWLKEDKEIVDDLSIHSIFAIKQRIEEKITRILKNTEERDFYSKIKTPKDKIDVVLNKYFDAIYRLEQIINEYRD
ncbi:DUF1071 domain-containing protein [bacterium]|nr:DUF1071 domain-containing protein [bacterium]